MVVYQFLLELAQEKNKQPLPLIPEKYGIRLPADKHCLTGINFSIVPDVSINYALETHIWMLNDMLVHTGTTTTKTHNGKIQLNDD